MGYLPGTMLKIDEYDMQGYEARIRPLLTATGGLMLSQVEGITGLNASTVQNWIKRGWVPPTQGKRYNHRQIYRIILINLLRAGMALESIIDVLKYINGDLDDEGDDIVSDSMLLDIMYDIIFRTEKNQSYASCDIAESIDQALTRYSGIYKDRTRLAAGLNIFTHAYIASVIKTRTARLFKEIGE